MDYNDEPKYFAVPDPDTGDMTYWFKNRRGQLQAWPTRPQARYGPILWKKPGVDHEHVTPEHLKGSERAEWVHRWYDTVLADWRKRVEKAIEEDATAAVARFTSFSSRCCVCGKQLTDAASKVWGIGPECRQAFPPEVLEDLARQIGRLHAQGASHNGKE